MDRGRGVALLPPRREAFERERRELMRCERPEGFPEFLGDLIVVGLRLPAREPRLDGVADGAEDWAFFLCVARRCWV